MNLKEELSKLSKQAVARQNDEMFSNLVSYLQKHANQGVTAALVTVGMSLSGPFGSVFGCREVHLDMLKKNGLDVQLYTELKNDRSQNVFKVSW